jgi:hypothetical protein
MPSTYTLISSNTLGASAASVTFSAIPSTFTDLVLQVSAQAGGSGYNFDNITITLNGSGTTSQSNTRLVSDATTPQSNAGTNQGIIIPNILTKGIVAGSPWCSLEFYVPNYTSSANKPSTTFGVGEANQTNAWLGAVAGLLSTTSTITSIVLTGSADFNASSSFYLYGIKNS